MPQAQFRPMVQATLKRRSFLGASAIGLGAIGMWPELQTFAADAKDFVMGPPVKDIPPIQVSTLPLLKSTAFSFQFTLWPKPLRPSKAWKATLGAS